jgi:hypothetical protein
MADDPTYVYVIGESEEGPVKIGRSNSPLYRMSMLQGGNGRKLSLYYFEEAKDRSRAHLHEQHVHFIFEDKRMVGEWFDISVAEAIQAILYSFEVEVA